MRPRQRHIKTTSVGAGSTKVIHHDKQQGTTWTLHHLSQRYLVRKLTGS